MLKKWISLIALMGGIVSVTAAQEATREASPTMHLPHDVQGVSLVQTDAGYDLVVTGNLPTGCDLPSVVMQDHTGTALFIDLYQEMPFDTVCPEVLKSFELHVKPDTGSAFPGEPPVQVIVVNGKLFGVDTTQEPLALNELMARGPLPYEHVVIAPSGDEPATLTLTGMLTDGCAIPVYRAAEDWQNPGFLVVDAYTAIPLNAMCAQVMTPFEAVMSLPEGITTLAINGVSVPFDAANTTAAQDFVEQPLSVTDAKAEWVEGLLPNVKVTVSGITDGCDAPIQLVPQAPVDNTYAIKVVRVLPAETACTKIARDFTQEVYISPKTGSETPLTFYIGDKTITLGK